MFLITIKKAADQGATCKKILEILISLCCFMFYEIHLLALFLMFCVCACIFLASTFCKTYSMYSFLEQ